MPHLHSHEVRPQPPQDAQSAGWSSPSPVKAIESGFATMFTDLSDSARHSMTVAVDTVSRGLLQKQLSRVATLT